MIVGLISSYRDGRLLVGAVRSLVPACNLIGVFEGPVGKAPATGEESPWKEIHKIQCVRTFIDPAHVDEAAKRTSMLMWAQGHHRAAYTNVKGGPHPLWIVWVDSDEVLLWSEYLPDMIERAQQETGTGGFPLRIVELDGSVALGRNRVMRGDMIAKLLLGASQVELVNGMVVALPNEKLCAAGGIPAGAWPHEAQGDLLRPVEPDHPRAQEYLGVYRPPVAGEPHILHRSVLRDKERGAERQHLPEAEWFKDQRV